MADHIKIPHGHILSLSQEEWAMIAASLSTMVEFFGEGITERDGMTLESLQELLSDVLTARGSYGSRETH